MLRLDPVGRGRDSRGRPTAARGSPTGQSGHVRAGPSVRQHRRRRPPAEQLRRHAVSTATASGRRMRPAGRRVAAPVQPSAHPAWHVGGGRRSPGTSHRGRTGVASGGPVTSAARGRHRPPAPASTGARAAATSAGRRAALGRIGTRLDGDSVGRYGLRVLSPARRGSARPNTGQRQPVGHAADPVHLVAHQGHHPRHQQADVHAAAGHPAPQPERVGELAGDTTTTVTRAVAMSDLQRQHEQDQRQRAEHQARRAAASPSPRRRGPAPRATGTSSSVPRRGHGQADHHALGHREQDRPARAPRARASRRLDARAASAGRAAGRPPNGPARGPYDIRNSVRMPPMK